MFRQRLVVLFDPFTFPQCCPIAIKMTIQHVGKKDLVLMVNEGGGHVGGVRVANTAIGRFKFVSDVISIASGIN